MKPELDIDAMRRLYEFGGLQVYEVIWFDPLTFMPTADVATFSEEFARERYASITSRGTLAKIDCRLVKFNGAFAKKSGGAE